MSSYDLSKLTRINAELKREIAERENVEDQLEQRNLLLSTLLDVSNLVSSTLELKPLLESILDRLKTILDYSGAKIFVFEGDVLKLAAHRSPLSGNEESNYSFIYNKVPMGQEIIRNKKPVVITDVQSDTPEAKLFQETMGDYLNGSLGYIRSWVGIPLIVKDKAIGILTIDHSKPGYYHLHHAELGMAFANQAAIEFENARLYNETQKKSDELKTMLAVQQAITSRLDLDSVLKMIADESRRLTNSNATAVFLVDGEDLVFSVFSGKVKETLPEEGSENNLTNLIGYRLPIKDSIMGRNMLLGKSVILKDIKNEPDAYMDLIEKSNIDSCMSVPLIAGSNPIGIIAASNKIKGNFSAEDERILGMLASHAVIGIENARMYEDERRRHMEDKQRRRVAESLRDILAKLNSNRPLEEVLEFIVYEAVRLTGTDAGVLYRFEDEKDILTMKASCIKAEDFKIQAVIPEGEGVTGRAIAERKPAFCKGMLAVPLICKDEVYGCIALYFNKERDFLKDEIELAAAFANQAALAIDNAVLRAQSEEAAKIAERNRLARDLHDAVTQTLFSASLIAEVLPKIWERSQTEGLKRLDELRQLTRGALAEMRTLLLELRPTTLVETGLEELLKHLALAVTGRARIPVSLDMEDCSGIPVDIKIGMYRIVQEALNNIAKHSGATQAGISVKCRRNGASEAEQVELTISDNGQGFNRESISGDHLGLGIMQERAEAIGAAFTANSAVGKGTDIIVRWEKK